MGSRRIALRRLSPSQNRIIIATQFLFFVGGLMLFVFGGIRVAIEFSEELFDVNSDNFKEGVANWITGDTYTTPGMLLVSIVILVAGYGLLWCMAALGTKSPPAWSAARNGLMGLILSCVGVAAVLIIIDAPFLIPTIVLIILAAAVSVWLLLRVMQADFRLVLGAERIKRQNRATGEWVLYGVVVVALSALSVLGLVYAVLTDVIELPVDDVEPGELIYLSTFDDFNDEWDLVDDSRVSTDIMPLEGNNALFLSIPSTSDSGGAGPFTSLDRTLRNFDLRVTTTQLEDNPSYSTVYGIQFGFRSLDEPFFQLQLAGNGDYRLMKILPGDADDITISTWNHTTDTLKYCDEEKTDTAATLIRPGCANPINTMYDRQNEVRVVVRDQTFAFYINGERLPLCLKGTRGNSMWIYSDDGATCVEGNVFTYTYTDDDYRQGEIGFFAIPDRFSDLDVTVEFAFDNVVIVGPPDDLSTSILEGADTLQ